MGRPPDPGRHFNDNPSYTPFVCILNWPPQGRSAAISKFLEVYKTIDEFEDKGKDRTWMGGIRGLHGWRLMGRDTMILIGWYYDVKELQKFCTRLTLGTDITVDVCPAIDHIMLREAFKELMVALPNFPK